MHMSSQVNLCTDPVLQKAAGAVSVPQNRCTSTSAKKYQTVLVIRIESSLQISWCNLHMSNQVNPNPSWTPCHTTSFVAEGTAGLEATKAGSTQEFETASVELAALRHRSELRT